MATATFAAPAMYVAQAPVVEYISPAPAVPHAAPAPIVEYIASAPAVYAALAPVAPVPGFAHQVTADADAEVETFNAYAEW